MSESDHTFQLAQSVGSLERAVNSLEKTIDGFRLDMKDKIDERQGEAIANKVVGQHVKDLHPKDSIPPGGMSIKISKSLLAKIGIWVAGLGGSGFGIWSIVERFLGN